MRKKILITLAVAIPAISTVGILILLVVWHSENTADSALQLAAIESQASQRFWRAMSEKSVDGVWDRAEEAKDSWFLAIRAHRLRFEREGHPITDQEMKEFAQSPFIAAKSDYGFLHLSGDPALR